MPLLTIETSIAVNHNNAAGLALVTSLSASSIPFLEVRTLAHATNGLIRYKANRTADYTGDKSTFWTSSMLWVAQFAYLRANYEGLVTIRTPFEGVVWANYNATLVLGNLSDYDEPELDTEYGPFIRDFKWQFTGMVAL
jgi:hypothetical protein